MAKKKICPSILNCTGRKPVMPYCKKCGNEFPKEAQYCPVCGTARVVEVAPIASVEPIGSAAPNVAELKLAFWWERFVAWLIDVVVIGIVLGILGLFAWFAGQPSLLSGWPSWIPFLNLNLNGVIYFLYWMLMDGAYGQSFGKMVMRIKITRLDGNPMGWGNAALESVGKAFLLPLDCLLGWILYPKKRQRIFNYISETIVTKIT
jgi:uncharacterized RDD family membrane protein YckC